MPRKYYDSAAIDEWLSRFNSSGGWCDGCWERALGADDIPDHISSCLFELAQACAEAAEE